MRNPQDARGLGIVLGICRKHEDGVGSIHRDVVNFSVLWIDIEPVVIFVLGVRSLHNALRRGGFGARRRIIQPVEYPYGEQIGVLKDDFVTNGIDRDRTVNGIRVANCANRRTSNVYSGGRINFRILEFGAQSRDGADGHRSTRIPDVRQSLDRNQSSRACRRP